MDLGYISQVDLKMQDYKIVVQIIIFLGIINPLTAKSDKKLDNWLPKKIKSSTISNSRKGWGINPDIIYFKNGKKFQTTLYGVKFIGLLRTKKKNPYLILSGKGCNRCDMNTSIYIHSISDGSMKGTSDQKRYSYPGKEYYYEDGSLLTESRAFWGKCLSKDREQLIWDMTLHKEPEKQKIIYLVEVGPKDNLREEVIKNKFKVNVILKNIRKDTCKEIKGMVFTSEP